MKSFLLLLFSFLLVLPALAQYTAQIETDRPDQTESPFLTPRHFFQGEFGFNIVTYKDRVQQLLHPTALLKYGWSSRVEGRIELTPYTSYIPFLPDTKTETKLEPVEIGAKIRLFEEKGLRPKTSLIAHIGLPFAASREFRSSPLVYTTRLTFQNSLSEAVALGYNLGVERDVAAQTSFFYTFAPGFNIGQRWYAYIEAFGSFASTNAEHNIDAGIAYSPSSNTKIDVSGGFGLNPSALKNYIAIGFSFRVPLQVKEP